MVYPQIDVKTLDAETIDSIKRALMEGHYRNKQLAEDWEDEILVASLARYNSEACLREYNKLQKYLDTLEGEKHHDNDE